MAATAHLPSLKSHSPHLHSTLPLTFLPNSLKRVGHHMAIQIVHLPLSLKALTKVHPMGQHSPKHPQPLDSEFVDDVLSYPQKLKFQKNLKIHRLTCQGIAPPQCAAWPSLCPFLCSFPQTKSNNQYSQFPPSSIIHILYILPFFLQISIYYL